MKTWLDSVRDAAQRICSSKNSRRFTNQQLLQFELDQIVEETDSQGKTPERTLSRVLQELRDMGEVEFLDKGVYELRIGIANIDSERKEKMLQVNFDNKIGRAHV